MFRKNNPKKSILLVRTDFSNETAWKDLCWELHSPHQDFGILSAIDFYSNPALEGINVEELPYKLSKQYPHSFIFIADKMTFAREEQPLLCVSLINCACNFFRILPSEIWNVENNLSLTEMAFEEIAKQISDDGVYTGG
ncbi:MAG: hypothetical protein PSX81_09395 [bacterium]|nr:hypothetical protein [bacterium]